jgi:hypothetical protein
VQPIQFQGSNEQFTRISLVRKQTNNTTQILIRATFNRRKRLAQTIE